MLSDIVLIFLASFISALIAEGISWILIYRTEEYQKLKANIDRLQKKVDKKKESTAILKNKSKDKKYERYEDTLKTAGRDMAMTKLKSVFAVGVSLIGLFGLLSSNFDGKVIAKLPFEPFGFLTGITHRNLPGNDYTDCSFIFIYILSSMGIRANLQKLLGIQPTDLKQANPWG